MSLQFPPVIEPMKASANVTASLLKSQVRVISFDTMLSAQFESNESIREDPVLKRGCVMSSLLILGLDH
jgi:hypothetical protein